MAQCAKVQGCTRPSPTDARSSWARQGPCARALDNVFTERLWRTLKWEEIYLCDYASPREAQAGLARYLPFYNHVRAHSALGGLTPATVYGGRVGGEPLTIDPIRMN